MNKAQALTCIMCIAVLIILNVGLHSIGTMFGAAGVTGAAVIWLVAASFGLAIVVQAIDRQMQTSSH
jgi:hypothetical protein